jgi:hypothetical protein
MGMAPKISDLRKMSDDEVEAAYDAATANTVVGTRFWQDELVRRQEGKQTEALIDLTKQLRNLTIWLIVFTVIVVILTALLVWKEVFA